jgi:hypothetical protein
MTGGPVGGVVAPETEGLPAFGRMLDEYCNAAMLEGLADAENV